MKSVTRLTKPLLNDAPRVLSSPVPLRPRRRIQQSFTPYGRRASATKTTTTTTDERISPRKPFWTGTRAFLLSAFAGSLAYILGVTDAANNLDQLWPHDTPRYGTMKDLEKAIEELRILLGEDAISTDTDDLKAHGYSEWSSLNIDQLPVAVAYPQTTEDVAKIAQICHKHKMPMVPYSGGSSLEANFSAPFGGMSIDFAFMDHFTLHEDDMDVVVQPGLGYMQLNDSIKHTGLWFPVDPGPSAKFGGMVGTGCSGTNAFRYGTMREWVINLTVVLADGRVIVTRRRPRKTAAGYNLTGLFVGAEGTLGIVTEATLKLAVIPQSTKVGVVTFPTLRDAASAATQVIRSGVPVAAMEIMDEVQMSVINRAGATPFRTWDEVPTIFFKFSGTTAGVQDNMKLTTEIAKANKAKDFVYAKTEKEAHDLWTARKESLWSMLSLRKEGDEVWSTDVGVPISRLPDIIEKTKLEMDDLNLFASVLGHIGDGNFHTSILYQAKDPAERAKVEKFVHNMVDTALEMEGTCTGEHSIGLGKKESLLQELGPDTVNVMRILKRSLDPDWLMNPGKIFDESLGSTKSKPEATAASTLSRPQKSNGRT